MTSLEEYDSLIAGALPPLEVESRDLRWAVRLHSATTTALLMQPPTPPCSFFFSHHRLPPSSQS